MTDILARYQCPKCGAGLSYTSLRPRWRAYEAFFPDLKVPVVRICSVVVVTGALLALVHPLLAAVGVLGVGGWAWYRYFAPLQCDGCRSYFISGRFAHGSGTRLPWTAQDSWRIARRALVAVAVIGAVFGIIYGAQKWYISTCSTNCEATGLRMDPKSRLFECNCTSAKP